MKPALFVDRDGVLTELVAYPDTGEHEAARYPSDLQLIPGALEALTRLQEQGWLLFLVSNQPSHAKGKSTLENLKAVHVSLEQHLSQHGIVFQDFYYCYHHPNGVVAEYTTVCDCRKPGIGSLLKAKTAFDLDFANCCMIGDQDWDVLCGQKAGCRTIQIEYEYSASKRGTSQPDWSCRNLAQAVSILSAVRQQQLSSEVNRQQHG